MSQELPIACTLDATQFASREQLMADLGRDALLDARQDGTRAILRFAADARDRVDSFVAGESSCCAFLAMNVTEGSEEVVLTIDTPADAEPVLAEMVAAFGDDDRKVA